ncbi:MAG TPA: hypothetical protein VLQ45_24605 [Thermoanaerobaculia bacterium]|nr:hypothetical protein [Thermoanaerobaculia bacterium]HSN89413.1 hypothetical protein [Thermoanaerobaculia bacterium]
MKKRFPKKLSLSRETILRLTDLARVGGAADDVAIGKDTALSITECTRVISDCLTCTTPQASCPQTMFSYCTCA